MLEKETYNKLLQDAINEFGKKNKNKPDKEHIQFHSFPFQCSQTSLDGVGGQAFTTFQAFMFLNEIDGDCVVYAGGCKQYISDDELYEGNLQLAWFNFKNNKWKRVNFNNECT